MITRRELLKGIAWMPTLFLAKYLPEMKGQPEAPSGKYRIWHIMEDDWDGVLVTDRESHISWNTESACRWWAHHQWLIGKTGSFLLGRDEWIRFVGRVESIGWYAGFVTVVFDRVDLSGIEWVSRQCNMMGFGDLPHRDNWRRL